MDLLLEKINLLLKEETVVNQYGVRVYFIGNLKLLSDHAAGKLMKATADNSRAVFSICLAYTSRFEIVHAVEESCMQKSDYVQESCKDEHDGSQALKEKIEKDPVVIKLVVVKKHMYMAVAPDPDIMIRSSGETRLSNFLLWQTSRCLLYSPAALWPEIGLWHLVLAILNFQRHHTCIEKKTKQF